MTNNIQSIVSVEGAVFLPNTFVVSDATAASLIPRRTRFVETLSAAEAERRLSAKSPIEPVCLLPNNHLALSEVAEVEGGGLLASYINLGPSNDKPVLHWFDLSNGPSWLKEALQKAKNNQKVRIELVIKDGYVTEVLATAAPLFSEETKIESPAAASSQKEPTVSNDQNTKVFTAAISIPPFCRGDRFTKTQALTLPIKQWNVPSSPSLGIAQSLSQIKVRPLGDTYFVLVSNEWGVLNGDLCIHQTDGPSFIVEFIDDEDNTWSYQGMVKHHFSNPHFETFLRSLNMHQRVGHEDKFLVFIFDKVGAVQFLSCWDRKELRTLNFKEWLAARQASPAVENAGEAVHEDSGQTKEPAESVTAFLERYKPNEKAHMLVPLLAKAAERYVEVLLKGATPRSEQYIPQLANFMGGIQNPRHLVAVAAGISAIEDRQPRFNSGLDSTERFLTVVLPLKGVSQDPTVLLNHFAFGDSNHNVHTAEAAYSSGLIPLGFIKELQSIAAHVTDEADLLVSFDLQFRILGFSVVYRRDGAKLNEAPHCDPSHSAFHNPIFNPAAPFGYDAFTYGQAVRPTMPFSQSPTMGHPKP